MAADVRRVKAVLPTASLRHICRILDVPRSALYPPQAAASQPLVERTDRPDDHLMSRVYALIQQHPTYGYRRIWALLRFGDQLVVNRKRIYRLMRRKGWLVCQRRVTPKPRVIQLRSVAQRTNQRWAMDVTHIPVGQDGWAHLTVVIDCYDREVVGFEFALRGRAKEAERALEAACLQRFGTIRPEGATPIIRSDNGLQRWAKTLTIMVDFGS